MNVCLCVRVYACVCRVLFGPVRLYLHMQGVYYMSHISLPSSVFVNARNVCVHVCVFVCAAP